jgi:hypothetical protein
MRRPSWRQLAVAVFLLVAGGATLAARASTPTSDIPERIQHDAMPEATWQLREHRDFGPGGLRSWLPGPLAPSADDVRGEWVWQVHDDREAVLEAVATWLLGHHPPDAEQAPGGQARVGPTVGLEQRSWEGWIGRYSASSLSGTSTDRWRSDTVLVTVQTYAGARDTTEVRVRN